MVTYQNKGGRPAILGAAIPGVRHSEGPPFRASTIRWRTRFMCVSLGVREYRGPRVSRSLSIVGWLQKKGGDGWGLAFLYWVPIALHSWFSFLPHLC